MRTSIIVSILLIILVCTPLIDSHQTNLLLTEGVDTSLCLYDPVYILDQYQTESSHRSSIHSSIWMAQSFKPSMTPLTKVELKIEKYTEITSSLELSIRKSLDSSELSYTYIPANEIPYYVNWLEFDFPDIEVKVNETYYIVVRTRSPSGQSCGWMDLYSQDFDYYPQGEQWFSNNGGDTWERTSSDLYDIDTTFRTYSYESTPDLYGEGSFNWTEVRPGDMVTGSFTISNIGTPLSYLTWKIYQWPSWGTWTFSQSSGSELTPEDGEQTISVTVEAPHTDIPDTYLGKITIINQENPDDLITIDATMVTPHMRSNQYLFSIKMLSKIFQGLNQLTLENETNPFINLLF